MNFRKTLILCILVSIMVPSLKADYYQSDLFPIGLTGINGTGGNPPYSNAGLRPPWGWTPQDNPDNNEQDLILNLGVNCIGCEDANPYIGSFDTTECRNRNNYLYRICIPSFADDGDSTNPGHIYIIEFIDITELIDSLLIDSLADSLNLED